jgi:catechol 2,3-dioxygenase-like lactoylglutathione lyase family enzyme
MSNSGVTFGLDHIVILVDDLDRAIADYRALGFNIFPGGEHPGRGTHNALVVFADGAYLELIAFKSPVPGFRWWHVYETDGEGFVDFALLPSDVDAAVTAARSRGVAVPDPENGGRARPDGVAVAWRNARPPTSDLPFLCFDVTPRNLRVPEGKAREHANGVTGVARLTVAVADLAASLTRYEAYLGIAPIGSSIMVGAFAIELVQASPERLAKRGEGPVAMTLRADRSRKLDRAIAHGAEITLATQ